MPQDMAEVEVIRMADGTRAAMGHALDDARDKHGEDIDVLAIVCSYGDSPASVY